MNSSLIPITYEEFKDKVSIRFNNILDGLDSFENFTITCESLSIAEEKFITYIKKIFRENNNICYIDFYLSRLDFKDKENLLSLAPKEDIDILKEHLSVNFNSDFFKVENEDLLPFLIRLCTREIFFITFYFVNTPITIWGNYNLKFPCFCNDKSIMQHYNKMAQELNIV